MRLNAMTGGKFVDANGGQHTVAGVKIGGRVIWPITPGVSLELSVGTINLLASGGQSAITVTGVETVGGVSTRTVLSASDLTITKSGDSGNRITRDGLTFSAEHLHTTVCEAATATYTILWTAKNVSATLTVNQAANVATETPGYRVNTGFGGLTFSPESVPVAGGIVDVYGQLSYDQYAARYDYTSGDYTGGTVTHLSETVSPNSVSCQTAQSVTYNSLTFRSNEGSAEQIIHQVTASYGTYNHVTAPLNQAADSPTLVTRYENYDAHISIFDSKYLTLQGGYCYLKAYSSHENVVVRIWPNGSEEEVSRTTVYGDAMTFGKIEEGHLNSHFTIGDDDQQRTPDETQSVWKKVIHQAMVPSAGDTVLVDTVTFNIKNDADLSATEPHDSLDPITLRNERHLTTPAHEEEYSWENVVITIPQQYQDPNDSSKLRVEGGEVEVRGTRKYYQVSALYTWDSGHTQGGTYSALITAANTKPTIMGCSGATWVDVSTGTVTLPANTQKSEDKTWTVSTNYNSIGWQSTNFQQARDVCTDTTERDNYHAHISILNSAGLTARGGACQLSIEAWHDERTRHAWASGGYTYSDWEQMDDNFTVSKSGTGSAYFTITNSDDTHIKNVEHQIMHTGNTPRSADNVIFIVTNNGDNTTQHQTNEITINNGYETVDEPRYYLGSLATAIGSDGDTVPIRAESYYYYGRLYESGLLVNGATYPLEAYLRTDVGSISPDSLDGSADATLTVPANESANPRTVTVRMLDGNDYSLLTSKTFIQDAYQKQLKDYVDVGEYDVTGSSRKTKIINSYTSDMFISVSITTRDNTTGETLLVQYWSGNVSAGSENLNGPTSNYGQGTNIEHTVIEARLV